MQAVITIPPSNARIGTYSAGELLSRKVAGVPLLQRVMLTAIRAGVTDIFLVGREVLGQALSLRLMQEISPSGCRLHVVQLSKFDPRDDSDWGKLNGYLKEEFLWIPWNWVTTKQFL